MRIPRRFVRLRRALTVGGYFWLPCPCCGQLFAGYEAGHRHVDIKGRSKCCCRWCDSCPAAEATARDLSDVASGIGGYAARAGGAAGWRCHGLGVTVERRLPARPGSANTWMVKESGKVVGWAEHQATAERIAAQVRHVVGLGLHRSKFPQ